MILYHGVRQWLEEQWGLGFPAFPGSVFPLQEQSTLKNYLRLVLMGHSLLQGLGSWPHVTLVIFVKMESYGKMCTNIAIWSVPQNPIYFSLYCQMVHFWDEDRQFIQWPESSHCKVDISAAFSLIHWVYYTWILEMENMTEINTKFPQTVKFVFF